MSVKIIADSTCDLTQELIKEYDAELLPLHILLGEEKEYKDGVDITPEEIYKWSDETGNTPKTSAPSLGDAFDILRKYKDEYDEIICFTISTHVSTSYNVFKIASSDLEIEDRVHVIDSKNLSCGIALLIMEASRLNKEGKSAKEIVEYIDQLIPMVRTSFILETLEYLSRGGRCNSLTAVMGGALKIHPVISLEDGELKVGKKYRGPFHKIAMHYVSDLKEELLHGDKKMVFVVHSGVDREILDEIKAAIEELNHFERIEEAIAGSVISSHCGPSTLGIMFRKAI